MAIKTKTSLKSFFQKADRPTSAQFSHAWDSFIKIPTSGASGQTTKVGFIEVETTASATAHNLGTFNRGFLIDVANTAAARDFLAVTSASGGGGGAAGQGIVAANVTASVVSQLGADTAGTAILQATVTASAVSQLGGILAEGYISGLILSNDGTDPAKDIGIAAGEARDDGNAVNMVSPGAGTKKLDASWVVGNNQGALDGTESVAGTPDANTWYHGFLIRRSDTGVVDVLFSESATAPTMPTNYDQKRRIGAVLFDATPDIIKFFQYGDRFVWDVPVQDYSADNPGNSAVTTALTVPTGVKVLAQFGWSHWDNSPVTDSFSIVTSLNQTDTAPSESNYTTRSEAASGARAQAFMNLTIETNTSAQIRSRAGNSAVDVLYRAITTGWIDPRGRNV